MPFEAACALDALKPEKKGVFILTKQCILIRKSDKQKQIKFWN